MSCLTYFYLTRFPTAKVSFKLDLKLVQYILTGRNLLDQLDVMYQRAFTASEATSSVPTGLYQIYPARERYYDICADHIKEKNVGMDKD